IHAAPEHVRASLNARVEIGLVELPQSVANLRGCGAVPGRKIADGVSHPLFKAPQIVHQTLAIVGQRLRRVLRGTRPRAVGIRARQITNSVRLIALFIRKAIRLSSQSIEASGVLLTLSSTQEIRCLAKPLGGTPGVGLTLPLRGSAPHVVVGLPKLIERLLDARVGCALAPLRLLS